MEKGYYSLRLAHHPNLKNTAEALFYNVVAEGEKAKEFYGLYITDTRMQLPITGSDITETVKKHKRTAGIIRGRKAKSDMLPEKVKLADLH